MVVDVVVVSCSSEPWPRMPLQHSLDVRAGIRGHTINGVIASGIGRWLSFRPRRLALVPYLHICTYMDWSNSMMPGPLTCSRANTRPRQDDRVDDGKTRRTTCRSNPWRDPWREPLAGVLLVSPECIEALRGQAKTLPFPTGAAHAQGPGNLGLAFITEAERLRHGIPF